jgi:hypothetical protein
MLLDTSAFCLRQIGYKFLPKAPTWLYIATGYLYLLLHGYILLLDTFTSAFCLRQIGYQFLASRLLQGYRILQDTSAFCLRQTGYQFLASRLIHGYIMLLNTSAFSLKESGYQFLPSRLLPETDGYQFFFLMAPTWLYNATGYLSLLPQTDWISIFGLKTPTWLYHATEYLNLPQTDRI